MAPLQRERESGQRILSKLGARHWRSTLKDHQLKAWLSVVDRGSIRAAARALRLTQPAITKAIRELEADLGTPLIRRSVRGIELTEFGRLLTVRARLAQRQLELAREEIEALRDGNSAIVRVAVTPMVLLEVMAPALAEFRARLPLARVCLFEGLLNTGVPMLREGQLDFAMMGTVPDALGPDFEFRPLRALDMAVLCRRGHPLAKRRTWQSLQDCEWLMHYAPGSYHDYLRYRFEQQGDPWPQRVTETSSFGTSMVLLTQSNALMIGPRRQLSVAPYSTLLRALPLQLDLPPLELGLVTLKGPPLSHAASLLADILVRRVATSPPAC